MPVSKVGTQIVGSRLMSRKSRTAGHLADRPDSGDLWNGAGWRLLMTAILLATISGLILLAGSLDIG